MARFQVGNKGRPNGAKEKSWSRISHWIDKLNAEWDKLTPNQKAHYSVELTKMLVSKLKSMPLDPSESKLNADDAMNILKEIETMGSAKNDVETPPKLDSSDKTA